MAGRAPIRGDFERERDAAQEHFQRQKFSFDLPELDLKNLTLTRYMILVKSLFCAYSEFDNTSCSFAGKGLVSSHLFQLFRNKFVNVLQAAVKAFGGNKETRYIMIFYNSYLSLIEKYSDLTPEKVEQWVKSMAKHHDQSRIGFAEFSKQISNHHFNGELQEYIHYYQRHASNLMAVDDIPEKVLLAAFVDCCKSSIVKSKLIEILDKEDSTLETAYDICFNYISHGENTFGSNVHQRTPSSTPGFKSDYNSVKRKFLQSKGSSNNAKGSFSEVYCPLCHLKDDHNVEDASGYHCPRILDQIRAGTWDFRKSKFQHSKATIDPKTGLVIGGSSGKNSKAGK